MYVLYIILIYLNIQVVLLMNLRIQKTNKYFGVRKILKTSNVILSFTYKHIILITLLAYITKPKLYHVK